MPIQLIVASPEPRFHDFVQEQMMSTANAEIVGQYEDMGPNLSVRILQDLHLHPHAAVLLDISSDSEHGLRILEQVRQSAPDSYIILSSLRCSEDFLLRSMRLGGADFLMQP